jgi:predicted O-linked N-acetylglucosamine transferase (SPINDLY family)
MFINWLNILKRVDNSVLWILHNGKINNMIEEAIKYGVNPERLIFVEQLEKIQHLKRMQQADLLLDTSVYNAHTSAGDALWAGLPILTILGNTMPSRVCASMIIDTFPEMVVDSFEEYEERAVYLGNNINELKELRRKVELGRENMKLFDTVGYVNNFEKGLKCVWKQFVENNTFEHIIVKDL